MFDKTKPYNDLPLLPPKKIDFESKKILKQLTKAKMSLASLDTLIRNIDNKDIFLEHFAIKESVDSSQIENINTTVETTYQAEFEKTVSYEQKESLNYKKALLEGLDDLNRKGFLNRNSIQTIGLNLNKEKGYIRSTSNSITKSGFFGTEVIYTPPIGMNREGKNVLDVLFKNYEEFYNSRDYGDIDPLIRMGLIHYQFEAIHPFGDGNGRTGRILMILYLMLHEQLSYPILFISGFINQHRNDYYELLRNITEKNQWEEFIYFILIAIEQQSNKTIKTIENLIKYQKDLRKQLFEIKNIKAKNLELLYELLSSKPMISLTEIMEKTNVSRDTVTTIVKNLVENKIVVEKKVGYSKILYNKNFLKLFQN